MAVCTSRLHSYATMDKAREYRKRTEWVNLNTIDYCKRKTANETTTTP